MNLIVAVDNNFGIGMDSKLLYDIPADMEFFKNTTMGKVVVMGDLTLFSLPNSKPLKNRTNLIISYDKNLSIEGAKVFNEKQDMIEYINKNYETDDVFIIGGAFVYREFLPFCKYAYITRIDDTKEANKFFPNIDKMPNWKLIEKSEDKFHNGIKFNFCKYENIKVTNI